MKEVFTPMSPDRTKRYKIPMSEVKVISGDLDKRVKGLKAIVMIKGVTLSVHGVSCGLKGCNCDAILAGF